MSSPRSCSDDVPAEYPFIAEVDTFDDEEDYPSPPLSPGDEDWLHDPIIGNYSDSDKS